MDIRKLICLLFILLLTVSHTRSQNFVQPNFALKSHETLEIKKIEITSEATTFYISIENQTSGGYFCADKNIFIIYPDGKRSKLTSSSGIPVCPETYKFKTIGERFDFVLTFAPLKKGTDWVDLIEDCSEHCFSFYGISLDVDLNKKIDEAFRLAENNEPVKALSNFINICEETDNKNLGVEGLLYINIIKLAKETGDTAKATEWYHKLKSSSAPRLSQYIKFLNDQGIKF